MRTQQGICIEIESIIDPNAIVIIDSLLLVDYFKCQLHEKYKTIGAARNVCIEIGMHSTILSGILIENGLDVSYTLCFTNDKNTWTDKGFDFLEDEVYFIMSTGYRDPDRYKSEQYKKPLIENVVKYIL